MRDLNSKKLNSKTDPIVKVKQTLVESRRCSDEDDYLRNGVKARLLQLQIGRK